MKALVLSGRLKLLFVALTTHFKLFMSNIPASVIVITTHFECATGGKRGKGGGGGAEESSLSGKGNRMFRLTCVLGKKDDNKRVGVGHGNLPFFLP